jgi:hypothetical protein
VTLVDDDEFMPPLRIRARTESGAWQALKIDADLKALEAATRAPKLVHQFARAQQIARRSLEVAFLNADLARRQSPGPIIDDFESIADAAADAQKALKRLLHRLSPNDQSAAALALPILTAQAGKLSGDARALHAQAKADAKALLAAQEVIARLGGATGTKAATARKDRKNEGKPMQTAFLAPLAEGWIHLTGRAPSKTREVENNAFLRFARHAWADVYDPDGDKHEEDFIGALTQLQPKSAAEFAALVKCGPYWL